MEISAPVDTISSLPDAILCRFLSLLTTKEAVATSVLSKRWIHLFLSVPNLHFTNINVDSVESTLLFNEFVYSILVSRYTAGSNLINSFRLDIGFDNPNLAHCYAFPSITKWVNLVVQRKLEHLRLHIHVDYSDINYDYDYDYDYNDVQISTYELFILIEIKVLILFRRSSLYLLSELRITKTLFVLKTVGLR